MKESFVFMCNLKFYLYNILIYLTNFLFIANAILSTAKIKENENSHLLLLGIRLFCC